jgi:serine/threonine protein kinase
VFKDNELTSNCDLWSFGAIAFDLLAIKSEKRFKEVYSANCNYNEFLNDEHATNLISQLIQSNPTDRIPINKIKTHEFFKEINWSDLQ